MEVIQIKAEDFFNLLKERNVSMWDVFLPMVDGTEKELVFINPQNQVLFSYILPDNKEKLLEDKKRFAEEYAQKLSAFN